MNARLTERQIILERIEEACRPGTPVVFRRRILAECAAFIRDAAPARSTGDRDEGPGNATESPSK